MTVSGWGRESDVASGIAKVSGHPLMTSRKFKDFFDHLRPSYIVSKKFEPLPFTYVTSYMNMSLNVVCFGILITLINNV